eukprot:9392109-Pyramimonas_sp.AAC.1
MSTLQCEVPLLQGSLASDVDALLSLLSCYNMRSLLYWVLDLIWCGILWHGHAILCGSSNSSHLTMMCCATLGHGHAIT